jgi:vesicle-fusing ATPase
LTEVGLSEVFDSELRVPPIAHLRALDCVLRDVELFQSSGDRRNAIEMLAEAGFASERDSEASSRLHIGIKKLLSIIEMARQEPDNIAQRLVGALTGVGM